MAPPRPAPAQLILSAVDPLPLRTELREIHRAALGAGTQSDDWADVRLLEHAFRPGFDFLVARADNATVGFGVARAPVRESRQARNFYAKHGWTELAVVNFGVGYPPYVAFGLSLTPPTS